MRAEGSPFVDPRARSSQGGARGTRERPVSGAHWADTDDPGGSMATYAQAHAQSMADPEALLGCGSAGDHLDHPADCRA